MENFGKFTTIVLFMILAPIVNGFVVVKLWHWFIVPTFEMNELRIVEAIGIMMLIQYVRAKKTNTDKEEGDFLEKLLKEMVLLAFMAGFALFFGWIVQMFI